MKSLIFTISLLLAGLTLGLSTANAASKLTEAEVAAIQQHLQQMAANRQFNVGSDDAAVALQATLYIIAGYPPVVNPDEKQLAMSKSLIESMLEETNRNVVSDEFIAAQANMIQRPKGMTQKKWMADEQVRKDLVKQSWLLRQMALRYALKKLKGATV